VDIFELHIRKLYKLIGHSGGHSQLHAHDTSTGRIIDRRLINNETDLIKWTKEFNGKGNLFVGRALRNEQGGLLTSNVLTLDIDPIREKGTAATEAQHQDAIKAGRELIKHFGHGVLASSGNGALVIFPTGKQMAKEECESLGKALEVKGRQILKDGGFLNVEVDSTWDHNRLIKLIGSRSTKGDISLHRQTRFLDINASGRLPVGFLESLTQVKQLPNQELPTVNRGDLDRSKADFAMGVRLQKQGFTASDTFNGLMEYGFRGREDDAKRIVEKLYAGQSAGTAVIDQRPLQLWTPTNGLKEYQQRDTRGTPELPTGFRELDKATFGLVRGGIFTVGARTNCGKTTFAITVASNLCRSGKRVLFVSTETQFSEVWDRYIAASTGVSAFKLQHGLDSDKDKDVVNTFIGEFKEQQFTVYDGSRPNIGIIRQAVEQVVPDVLVIDYFQHVEGREVRELEQYVMSVKELAKEKQVAVLMAAQLHDGIINPKTNKLYAPTLGSMKNSKVLNDESRVVVLLDWDRDSVQGDGPAAVKVIMAKNKGPKNDCVLKLDRSIPRFMED
jgi:KaiC/GvpD/RAD55 family RecA-like ATPase